MKVIINGEQQDLSPEDTLDTVTKEHKLPERSFVIELNGEIIDQINYPNRSLKEGDTIEIIRFVGGG